MGIRGCPSGYGGLGLSQRDQEATVPIHAPLLVVGPGRFQGQRPKHRAADWRSGLWGESWGASDRLRGSPTEPGKQLTPGLRAGVRTRPAVPARLSCSPAPGPLRPAHCLPPAAGRVSGSKGRRRAKVPADRPAPPPTPSAH